MSNPSRAGAGYRPYCDDCGERVWEYPISLGRARAVAQAHANATGHPTRIEPWDSYALIELVTPAFTTSWELLQYLLDLHQFVYRHLADPYPAHPSDRPGASDRESRG